MSENNPIADALAKQTSVFRGDLGYGKKAKRSTLGALAQYGPVAMHHYDQTTGQTTIDSFQDVNPVIEANQREYLSGHDGYSADRSWQKVASIPLIVVEELYKKGINIFNRDHWPKVAGMLDSSEWQKFRTAPGRISRRAVREYLSPRQKRKAK